MPDAIDPVELSQRLIRCQSVTPTDGGALAVLEEALASLGFTCRRLKFSDEQTPDVENLYARLGETEPNLCFAGHTDVVPTGDRDDWSVDPFAAELRDGRLYGRGAADMKAAIAAFVAATGRYLTAVNGAPPGSISLLITGDEEGPAINGTQKVLRWMADSGETVDACVVGEPTNPERLGDMIKIGRRGSLNAEIAVHGVQGHVAYPDHADNPIPRLLAFLDRVLAEPLDGGTEHFPPSRIEITSVDVGNPTTNLIPSRAEARLNIRFNDLHTGAGLTSHLETCRSETAGASDITVSVSGEAFLTPPGRLSGILADAVRRETGREAELSTTGGTSDARFIKDHCPTVEFGMINRTAHQTDEFADINDIEALSRIYETVLAAYFETA